MYKYYFKVMLPQAKMPFKMEYGIKDLAVLKFFKKSLKGGMLALYFATFH